MSLLFKNAQVMTKDFELKYADISVENGKITAVGQGLASTGEVFDLTGLIVVPGFVDIHIHGCAGFDASDGTAEALSGISEQLVTQGVTSFCPTTMTVASKDIEAVLLNIRSYMDPPKKGAAGSLPYNVRQY